VARVPIVHIGDMLLVAVQEELRDRDAEQLQSELNATIERSSAHGVLLDLSVVETLDSFLGRMISDIAMGARLLGAQTVIVGMQPAAAVTLVELGLALKGVHTALTPEKGMALLRRLIAVEHGTGGTRGR
jgi:rsbT antagonist protein RsbS